MSCKNWNEFPSILKNRSFFEIPESSIQNIRFLVYWCLYVSSRNIILKLSLSLQNIPTKCELKHILILECGLLCGDNLFNIESQKGYDSENFLYRTIKNRKPTIQEAVISGILDELQLRYITQWILYISDRHVVFDFLVEPNMAIECTFTDRKPSAVIGWLQGRALILDKKFKALKDFLKHEAFTLLFLESTGVHPTQLKAAIHDMEYTDKLVTSINEFEGFMREWKNDQVVSNKVTLLTPSSKVEVELWEGKDPQSTLERFI